MVNRSADTTRHSLVFFCNCDFDAVVETIPVPPAAAAWTGEGAGDAAAAAEASAAARADGRPVTPAAAHPPVKAGEYIMQQLGLMHS